MNKLHKLLNDMKSDKVFIIKTFIHLYMQKHV